MFVIFTLSILRLLQIKTLKIKSVKHVFIRKKLNSYKRFL